MSTIEDFEEELAIAEEKCKGHFEQYPRGFVRKFIFGISNEVQKIKDGDRKVMDYEVLEYNLNNRRRVKFIQRTKKAGTNS